MVSFQLSPENYATYIILLNVMAKIALLGDTTGPGKSFEDFLQVMMKVFEGPFHEQFTGIMNALLTILHQDRIGTEDAKTHFFIEIFARIDSNREVLFQLGVFKMKFMHETRTNINFMHENQGKKKGKIFYFYFICAPLRCSSID